MPYAPILLLAACLTADDPASAHVANPVASELLDRGLSLDGLRVEFPAPLLRDGGTAADQRKALEELAGGPRAADDLLRDSVTAPFVLKVSDETTKSGDIVRLAHLTFVVHADLDAFDPAASARQASGKATEVANMRFETSLLTPEALNAAGLPPVDPAREWFAHLSARMLDRIAVESTDRVVVSRSPESLVIASRTDPRLGATGPAANAWTPLDRDGKPAGPPRPYAGGASLTRVGRLAGPPGVLVIEARFAFLEPKGWFDGAPILRSKFAPIAQDQVRRLRREIRDRAR